MDGKCPKNWTKVFVKTFTDAKTICMNDYVKPSVRSCPYKISISSIIIRADDKKLKEKRCEANSFLRKSCKEKNFYLIYYSTRIKRNHLNKGKLHLNQKGTKLLSDIFVKELSKVFNWHNLHNLSKQFDVCDSD